MSELGDKERRFVEDQRSIEGIEWTEDHYPCWPVDWPQHHTGYVPEDLSLCSLRPATAKEAAFALELP